MTNKIGLIGGGAWGTALATILAEKGINVRLWVHEKELCQDIITKRENTLFLPGFKLSEKIQPTNDLKNAVKDKSIIVIATPSHVIRNILSQIKDIISPESTIVCVTKGIENETLKLPSQIIEEILSPEITNRACYLSGPTFAKEVAMKLPTVATIASNDMLSAKNIQQIFNVKHFRTYIHSDVLGVELGGALKNVIAIAAGISDGMENGHNAMAGMITRGLAEMIRLGTELGAQQITFMGLSGIGDLVLTCNSDLSRNRTVGYKLGQGFTTKEILSEMKTVAEGIKTTKSVMDLSKKHNVELPIMNAVYSMLYEGKPPKIALDDLLTRKLKKEFC